jgi:hypothetical protein
MEVFLHLNVSCNTCYDWMQFEFKKFGHLSLCFDVSYLVWVLIFKRELYEAQFAKRIYSY